MRRKKNALINILLSFVIVISVHASDITKQWEIFLGKGKNQIQLTQDMFYWFDFEVYNGKLFISDIDLNKIKIFDRSGKFIEAIKLPGTPEIMKIWDGILVVLIQNNQLAVYDIGNKKLDIVQLGVEIKPYDYSGAFFSDSLLFIPKSDKFVSIKRDAYVIDISGLPKLQITIANDVENIEKEASYPDSLLEIGKKYSIQQIDYCFNSKDNSIVERYDKNHPGSTAEYFYIEKKTNKFINLGTINEDKCGLPIHSNICRGFKIYKDGIYFIGEKYVNHKEKSLIISKIQ